MPSLDWLSRLLVMMPVSGQLEIRCSYGAPWRIAYDLANAGEMPYHVVLGGSAMLEIPGGGAPLHLAAGDIVLLSHGSEHVLHDGSGAKPLPVRKRESLMRDYFPATLVVRTSAQEDAARQHATAVQLATLVGLIRAESTASNLGGHAMLNAFSAALFALTLRMASESNAAHGYDAGGLAPCGACTGMRETEDPSAETAPAAPR